MPKIGVGMKYRMVKLSNVRNQQMLDFDPEESSFGQSVSDYLTNIRDSKFNLNFNIRMLYRF